MVKAHMAKAPVVKLTLAPKAHTAPVKVAHVTGAVMVKALVAKARIVHAAPIKVVHAAMALAKEANVAPKVAAHVLPRKMLYSGQPKDRPI